MDPHVFDLSACLARLGDDRVLFEKLVLFYFEDSPPLLEQLEAGLRSGNAADVERAAHSLKGLAANFSAEGAVAAAFRLEELGRSGNLSAALGAVQELRSEMGRLYEALAPFRPASNSAPA